MQTSERVVDTAQVLLTGYDIGLSRNWRDEDRKWRREDMDWREKEQQCIHFDIAFMQQERLWRQADVEQSHLNNARYLWQKFVAKNQREVEEKAGQLKAISGLAALLAGFAMVAFLEMQFTFDRPQQVPQYHVVLPLHGLTTGTTVAVEMTCVVMCTLMLSSVLRTGHSFVSEEEEAEFMAACKHFAAAYKPYDRPPAPARTFSAHWGATMERQWRHAVVLFSLGLPLFCLQLALASWVKFWQSAMAALVVSAVMGGTVGVLLLLQCVWKRHLLQSGEQQVADRYDQPPMGLPFDWHLKPQPPGLWRASVPGSAGTQDASAGTQDASADTAQQGYSEGDHMRAAAVGSASAAPPRASPTMATDAALGAAAGRAQHHQRHQHQWHRQGDGPLQAGSLLSWTLPAQVVMWLLHGLQHASSWLSSGGFLPAPTGTSGARTPPCRADVSLERHSLSSADSVPWHPAPNGAGPARL